MPPQFKTIKHETIKSSYSTSCMLTYHPTFLPLYIKKQSQNMHTGVILKQSHTKPCYCVHTSELCESFMKQQHLWPHTAERDWVRTAFLRQISDRLCWLNQLWPSQLVLLPLGKALEQISWMPFLCYFETPINWVKQPQEELSRGPSHVATKKLLSLIHCCPKESWQRMRR